MTYDLIIIGAGAAGLFAAANAPFGWNTLVLEKTEAPGQKLRLAGSGQCNLTNSEAISAFLSRYGENGKRLRPVLFPFSNLALMAYFEDNALPLYIREDGKVFPASMESGDVVARLLALSRERGVSFRYGAAVTELKAFTGPGARGFSLQTAKESFSAKRVLVATGGASYPRTGSDGTFFAQLEQLGLDLVPRRPALAPIFVQGYPYRELSGLTFPHCAVCSTNRTGGKPVRIAGSVLFTHKGFSGPAILALSRYVTQGDRLTINYLPHSPPGDLRRRLLQGAAGDPRQIVTLLESATSLPRRLLEQFCHSADIAGEEKASRLTGREMGALAERLTADTYEISGTGGFSVAMTTAGGVNLDEVDLRTMEAKGHPGLYFAGEVLDVDGDTGGYNLQFAFSSAMGSVTAMQAQ
ncbi:MAG: aminoacetone oxidase family FAD-binding enzyme [Oscillospiraceae bacterium]|nr:aminoacetone oxidase family FAD-binding enzyme [Oscillospiraceae bacterium]